MTMTKDEQLLARTAAWTAFRADEMFYADPKLLDRLLYVWDPDYDPLAAMTWDWPPRNFYNWEDHGRDRAGRGHSAGQPDLNLSCVALCYTLTSVASQRTGGRTVTTATATAPTGGAVMLDKYIAIFGADGFLNRLNVERREEIELLGLSTISAVDTLFLGDPGVGKTWAIELLVNECLTDMKLFSILLAKDMPADEVLGPRDIMAYKQGQIVRLMDGYLPSANYGYLDEVFKASPPLLNPLLDLLANRVLKVGGQVHDLSQLVTILMSSNELPDREDLMAFRDRIGMTKFVNPVRTPEGRRAVTDIQLDFQANGLDTTGLDPLSLDDIHAIRAEVRQVEVSDAIRQVMVDAQQKWMEAGHPPSQRRIGQMWKIVKARAWANGRDHVVADDFLPCQHMAWNHPDHANSARDIILEFASVFTRKANRLREAMEPIVSTLEELKVKLEAEANEGAKEDLASEAFKFTRQLRKLMKEANEQITEGKKQGQDTTLIEGVLSDIQSAHDWAEREVFGGES